MKNIPIQKLQEKAEALIRLYRIPSASITCYHDGQYESFCVGSKDLDAGLLANADTQYSIGSCTKSFTAAAIGILCDQGLLELDAPVRRYIQEFEMYDSYVSEHLTVRDMLCHRCGLPRHELAWYPRLAEYNASQMLHMLRYLKPNQPFRYKMQYQNMMYTLAGILIERVSGMSWADFLEKHLIAPLQMGKVAYDVPDLLTFESRAKGYRFYEDREPAGNYEVPYSRLYTMAPAGSMSMTSRQLAQWDALFLRRGKSEDGTQILSEKFCEEMTHPQMLISDPIQKPLKGYQSMPAYGLGFFLESYRGVNVVHHSGHIDGFISDQCFVPEKDFACTVLTNSEHPLGAKVLRLLILDSFLELPGLDWTTVFYDFYRDLLGQAKSRLTSPEKIAEASHSYPAPVSLSDICGAYLHKGYGSLTITEAAGSLLLTLGTLTLEGIHYRSQYFLCTEKHLLPGAELEAEVEIDRDGNVTAFLIGLETTSKEKIRFEHQ